MRPKSRLAEVKALLRRDTLIGDAAFEECSSSCCFNWGWLSALTAWQFIDNTLQCDHFGIALNLPILAKIPILS